VAHLGVIPQGRKEVHFPEKADEGDLYNETKPERDYSSHRLGQHK
jgi:hypothetical protein